MTLKYVLPFLVGTYQYFLNGVCQSPENVELILKSISNQHSSEGQDNDQPDYDSVASDEDTDLETSAAKSNRQKVGVKY